jgi:Tol biopolymer transport system component
LSDQPDDAWLIALGTDVSDGKTVDWDVVDRRTLDADARALVDNLKRLESVVQAHRASGSDAGDASDAPVDAAAAATGHWQHFVLFESVGAGAFGTVYRAWDTKVDREVALKLVPAGATSTRSPLSEARNLARIRHPNIVTVYGAEQDSEQVGIWMEFIQGETLVQMVRDRGPMSAREVVGIGVDLCRALSALQGASLLHRDIKAHNVMREVGGRIVLMDFSGAWTSDASETPANLSGTPLYMAPELFENRPPSVASDIYSLGVLLFYLLAARLPVDGPSLAELKEAHAKQVRTRLRDLRPELPDAVVQVVERAAAHDASERYQTAGELEHALVGTLGAHAALPSSTAAAEATVRAGVARGRRQAGWVTWTSVAVAALAVAALALEGSLRPTAEADPMLFRFHIGLPENTWSWPRLSPDGRQVVYGTTVEGRDVLWVRAMDAVEGRPIPHTSARETPFWSTDSRTLAFFDEGKLKKVPVVGGGEPQTIADAPDPKGGDWNHAGVLLFATSAGLRRVNQDGTGLAAVTTIDGTRGEYSHGWPEFLPDGRRFLFVIRSSQPEYSGIYLASLGTSDRKRLMPDYSRAAYSSGHLLFARDGALMMQRFDERSGELRGNPTEVAARLKYHAGGDAAFDVAGDVLIHRQAEGLPMTRLLLLDRDGNQARPGLPIGTYRHPRFSPDGKRIVMESLDPRSANSDLVIFDLARSMFESVTRSDAPDVTPSWSPDGREIAFSSKRGSRYETYTKVIGDVTPDRLRPGPEGDKYVEDWTVDGALIETVMRNGLWRAPLEEGSKPTQIRESARVERWLAEVSPDGRWIAYTSSEFGAPEVYVEPVDRSGARNRYKVSAQGGAEPHWRQDGLELYYLTADGYLAAVGVKTGENLDPQKPRVLFRASVPDPAETADFHVDKDGKLFVVNTIVGYPQVPPVHVVVNWTALPWR